MTKTLYEKGGIVEICYRCERTLENTTPADY